MLQQSKILQSREEWKNKAVQRADEAREFRKTQKRHLKKIANLKLQNHQLKQAIDDNKKNN
jgi:hypothetical protein